MEALQFLQYMVLDQCDHWLNKVTTVLSYIHICFQVGRAQCWWKAASRVPARQPAPHSTTAHAPTMSSDSLP
jgi:hypothetical protein